MLSFFQLDVLDEIWDVIQSVSEGFLTYSYSNKRNKTLKIIYGMKIRTEDTECSLMGVKLMLSLFMVVCRW